MVLEAGATYTLDNCEAGDIAIDGAVTIVGNGATVEQTCDDRVFATEHDLTLQNLTVTGGNTGGDGGGVHDTAGLTLTGVTFTDNAAEGHGGGVYVEGTASVVGSGFSQNTADSNVGGFGGGGAIYAAGPLTVSGSTFQSNIAHGDGGDSGGGAISSVGPSLSVDTSTFTGNTSDRNAGGAILTARIVEGGAIGDGNVISISRTTISGNGAPMGGGYANLAFDAAITITNSTITGNTSTFDGAIAASGDDATGVSLKLVNDTITDNVIGEIEQPISGEAADANASGSPAHTAEIPVTTLSIDGTYRPFGTVITGDGSADDCMVTGDAGSQGYNYGDDDTCGFTASTDKASAASPQLGALAANGGPTPTQLPATTSPLLDQIPPAACQVAIDQRGITRPQGTGCEIGAVEVEVVTPAPAAAEIVVTPKFTG